MDGTVLVALAELKIAVGNLTRRLEESMARSDARASDHSERIREVEADSAVLKSKVDSLERWRDSLEKELREDEDSRRIPLPAVMASIAALAATMAFIMQLGSKIGW